MNETEEEALVQSDRFAEMEQQHEFAALFAALYGLPHDKLALKVDALIVHPGMGETNRVLHAVRLWEDPGCQARKLVFTGEYDEEHTYQALTVKRLQSEFGLTRRPDDVLIHPTARHTQAQAVQMVMECIKHDIQSAAIIASPYHAVRAYLTDLKQITKINLQIPMFVSPAPIDFDETIPESGLTHWESIPAELERITRYQEKGDVATLEELRKYMRWLWTESGFLKVLA